jgi:predicted metal-dependent peptidase
LSICPQEAEEEARTIAELQKQVKQLKGDLTRAQRSSGAPDPAAVQRQVDAAVEKARATWTKDLRRIVGKDLVTLAGAIDKGKGLAGRLDRMLAAVVTAFLAVDGDLSPKGEINITPPERSPAAAPRPQSVPPARRPVSPPDGS